ncbi:MAG: SusC/RagA family TonB-linked outer membrane protein, partial [Microscillaceae bacterium]|nr:SusC/RagA family TonB-linked outer membrane protein [Microscillaceae bacterium]
MKQKLLLSMLLSLCLAFAAFAQDRIVKGRVTDPATGEGLPGVSVFVKGTTIGVVTNLDGTYEIKVPENAVLVFQAVGLKSQEMSVGTQSAISVAMVPDIKELGEVVITGYREESRETVTGAITTVRSKEIEQVPISSFDQILQGRAPGLLITVGSGQPGTLGNVRIRGIGSINASTQPLYIVDGVPINNSGATAGNTFNASNVASTDFAALNPNDFETVTVLKDASAAAIYGSRAANGVIVITTKRGKAGKTQFNYRFQQGFATRTTENFEVMNTQEKIQYEQLLFDQGIALTGTPIVRGQAGSILNQVRTGTISEAEGDELLAELSQINTDWRDVYFRTAPQQTHEFNASGGNDKSRFFVSASYRTEKGVLIRTGLERYTLRFNFDHSASDKVRLGFNTTLGFVDQDFLNTETGNNGNNPVLDAFLANPYTQLRDPESGEYIPGPLGFNLFEQMENSTNEQRDIKILSNAYVEYDIIEGLTVKTNWGVDYSGS